MSDFLTGMIVFLLIALGLGILVFYGVRSMGGREFRMTRRAFVYSLAIPVVLAIVFLGFFAFYEYHETAEFCGELCHSMGPKYEGYVNPENNSMMITHKEEGVPCTGCHVGSGWTGQVQALLSVPHEVVSELFNLYDIDDLGGIMHEESCIKCHDGDHAVKPGEVQAVDRSWVNPHEQEGTCFNCHPAHTGGFGVSLETCEICHGMALDDWAGSMEKHGERTGGECLDCHDRLHPDNARVPWVEVEEVLDMEFCQDCHPAEYQVHVDTETDDSRELYGECLDCHVEHDTSDAFHYHLEPYDNCTNCHLSLDAPGGIHDRTAVSYRDFEDLDNDLCEACHVDEIEGLDEHKQHRGLDCTYCHQEHLELEVDFDECTICHNGTIPNSHDSSLGGCTRGACHGRGWYH